MCSEMLIFLTKTAYLPERSPPRMIVIVEVKKYPSTKKSLVFQIPVNSLRLREEFNQIQVSSHVVRPPEDLIQ